MAWLVEPARDRLLSLPADGFQGFWAAGQAGSAGASSRAAAAVEGYTVHACPLAFASARYLRDALAADAWLAHALHLRSAGSASSSGGVSLDMYALLRAPQEPVASSSGTGTRSQPLKLLVPWQSLAVLMAESKGPQ